MGSTFPLLLIDETRFSLTGVTTVTFATGWRPLNLTSTNATIPAASRKNTIRLRSLRSIALFTSTPQPARSFPRLHALALALISGFSVVYRIPVVALTSILARARAARTIIHAPSALEVSWMPLYLMRGTARQMQIFRNSNAMRSQEIYRLV
jgi:hypothetical protein